NHAVLCNTSHGYPNRGPRQRCGKRERAGALNGSRSHICSESNEQYALRKLAVGHGGVDVAGAVDGSPKCDLSLRAGGKGCEYEHANQNDEHATNVSEHGASLNKR